VVAWYEDHVREAITEPAEHAVNCSDVAKWYYVPGEYEYVSIDRHTVHKRLTTVTIEF
jgi:hypothetical protein